MKLLNEDYLDNVPDMSGPSPSNLMEQGKMTGS
jgi:hypothetical protein